MMRIALLNTFFDPHFGGGAEVTLKSIVEGLAAHGHECHVITTGLVGSKDVRTDTRFGSVTRLGLKNIYWPYNHRRRHWTSRIIWNIIDCNNVAMGKKVSRYLSQIKPDIIFFHNMSGLSKAALRAAVGTGLPVVQVLHDYYSICPRTTMYNDARCKNQCISCHAFRIGYRSTTERLAAVVGVSDAIMNVHRENGYFSGVEQRIIYNARALDVQAPKKIGRELVFGFIGSITPAKGLSWLLESIRTAAPANKLLVAGTGDEMYVNSLKAAAADLPVEFLGHIDSALFFESVDVVVVPSVWNDPLPGVAYEAMAYGKPVIFSKVGGLPEIVPTTAGVGVDPDDPSSLVTALREMASGGELYYNRLAEGAVVAVEQFVEHERMINGYTRLIGELTSPTASAA